MRVTDVMYADTIMNSTRIMVLDRGLVVEFDTPEALARKPGGVFRKLLHDASESAAHDSNASAGSAAAAGVTA
jgi:hypothetical protein